MRALHDPPRAASERLDRHVSIRWVDVETFRDGHEANPYGPSVDARLQRLSAVPASEYNWLALGAIPAIASGINRRRKALPGNAWVPQHALRADRYRTVALAAAVAVWISLLVVASHGVEAATPLIVPAALVLFLARGIVQRLRVHAVYDRPTGQVGIVSRHRGRVAPINEAPPPDTTGTG